MMSSFWKDKRVAITGHTGFKGAWLTMILHELGAKTFGYALAPDTKPSLFEELNLAGLIDSRIQDVRNFEHVCAFLEEVRPEIVIHMAAQPLVRMSYRDPLGTITTNVNGVSHVLQACRGQSQLRVVLVVTSDKCYENKETMRAYTERDPLGGHDVYSASKACQELLTHAFRKSFFEVNEPATRVASARAGNVIGGGDWAEDRIVPDAIRAFSSGKALNIRNPDSVRPWQHVLDPLVGYLTYCERLYAWASPLPYSLNFSSSPENIVPVSTLVDQLRKHWPDETRVEFHRQETHAHEAGLLNLDHSLATKSLSWRPKLEVSDAIRWTAEWYVQRARGTTDQLFEFTRNQILDFIARSEKSS